jgi:hypothetical protein
MELLIFVFEGSIKGWGKIILFSLQLSTPKVGGQTKHF